MTEREPRDGRSGVTRYMKFHDFEPKKFLAFDPKLAIPREIGLAGKALFTTYRSDKWHKGKHYLRPKFQHELERQP